MPVLKETLGRFLDVFSAPVKKGMENGGEGKVSRGSCSWGHLNIPRVIQSRG